MAKLQLFLFQLLEIIAATALIVLGQSSTGDAMIPNSSLTNGQTLISAGGIFQLGFFSPAKDSGNRYLGIWYYNHPPGQSSIVVWVANRNRALNRASSSLNLTSNGNLIIFDGETLVWSTGTSTESNSVHLQLLDSGNLMLRTENFSRTLWQSFDYPSDTLLPGMKLGFDLRRNTSWQLVSWRNDLDPSLGNYINKMETHGVPELVAWNGTTKMYRNAPWSRPGIVGLPMMMNSSLARRVNFTFVSNENETYYMTEYMDRSVLSRAVINTDGSCERWTWDNGQWRVFWSFPADDCDHYNLCGHGSVCYWAYYAFSCSCLHGFVPSSNGCVREKPLNCSSGQVWKVQNVKTPDTDNATAHGVMSLDACNRLCLDNCSCVASLYWMGNFGV